MIDIYVVHNDPDVIKDIWEVSCEIEPFIHIMDIGSKLDKSKAFKFKQEWGARKDPFCLIEEDGKAIKAFYSETGEDAVSQLIKYLKHGRIKE